MKSESGFYRHTYTYKCRDLDAPADLVAALTDFFAQHGADGLVVSFIHEFPEAFRCHTQCKMWRDVFGYDRDFYLWGLAYERFDRMLEQMNDDVRDALTPFYHDGAGIMFRVIVYEQCDASLHRPVLFVVDESIRLFASKYGEYSAPRKGERLAQRYYHLVTGTRCTLAHIRAGIVRETAAVAQELKGILRRAALLVAETFRAIMRLVLGLVRLGWTVPYKTARFCYAVARLLLRPVTSAISRSVPVELLKRVRHRHNALRALKESLAAGGASEFVVMTVEDSGTGVNLNPALEILREFKARHKAVVVLTSYPLVAKTIYDQTGIPAIVIGHDIHWSVSPRRTRVLLNSLETLGRKIWQDHTAEGKLIENLQARVPAYNNTIKRAERALELLRKIGKVTAILTVYEVLPLSIVAGRWGVVRKIPWLGFFPILSGERPDGYYFPAPLHLVYGEQLRDIIVRQGQPPSSVQIVGSPTYDAFHGRDYGADCNLIESAFPQVRGKRLVVVATEAFADPLTELGPVLRSLTHIENTYTIVKLHPEDSPEYFQNIVDGLPHNGNMTVVGGCNLAALLHRADLLVCIISNIIVSAAVMGTPTLSCDFSGKRRVIDFVKEGLCFGCEDPDQVEQTLRRLLFDEQYQATVEEKLRAGIRRFNGLNDGKCTTRIVDAVLEAGGRKPGRAFFVGKKSMPVVVRGQREAGNTVGKQEDKRRASVL